MYAVSPFPGHKVVKVHQLGVPFQRWYSICSYGENGPLWHLRCKVIFRNHSNLGSYTYIWFVSSTTVNTIKYLVHGESFSILYHENLSLRHSLITFCSSPELNTLVLEFPASFFFLLQSDISTESEMPVQNKRSMGHIAHLNTEFHYNLPLEKSVALHLNKLESSLVFTQELFVPCLVVISQVILEKIFSNFVNLYSLFC